MRGKTRLRSQCAQGLHLRHAEALSLRRHVQRFDAGPVRLEQARARNDCGRGLAHNRCYYCLVAHGAAVRQLSGDPPLGELMVMNYRAARLSGRERAMLDFAVKLTAEPWLIEEEDRARLRRAGFSDRDIWDIAAVAGFFNMTNRVASATDMRPNSVYHGQAR